MIWLLYLVCGIAAAYQIVAFVAVLRHLFSKPYPAGPEPFVSLLKAVRGGDPSFEKAIESHASQNYPHFEILFGVNREGDPAPAEIERLQRAHPDLPISCRIVRTSAPNGKVGVLVALAPHARGEVWIVNDGDIRVTSDYLRTVAAPLADPRVGVVTCLYRVAPQGLPAAWEGLGIATEFAPSTLVAPMVGINEFGLGSTLCFRAHDLKAIGGFPVLADYLADDYQLACRITRQLGLRAVMSKLVVETGMAYPDWISMMKHQVRWARTIRVSRGDGYVGLPVTHAGLWALVALLSGQGWIACALVSLRMLTGFTAGYILLRTKIALMLPLIPLWDIWAFAIWILGLTGDVVEWRDRRYQLTRDGKLVPLR